MNRVAIVTGSSSGFGLLTSLEFAKRGFRVIATMRNVNKGASLIVKSQEIGVSGNIEIQELDVTSETSIQRFSKFVKSIGRVDILVNNAGYAGAGFAEEIPVAEYRKQFETNVFGLFAVTQSVIPIMRSQGKGKIINVSSISGKIGFPGMSPYVASKFAVEGWSECLRLELKPYGIDVALVEPGSYRTNIWTTGKQITARSLLEESPYHELMKKIESHIQKSEKAYGDPKEVAIKIADISMQKEMDLRYPVGKGVKLGILLRNTLSWKKWERMILKRLNK